MENGRRDIGRRGFLIVVASLMLAACGRADDGSPASRAEQQAETKSAGSKEGASASEKLGTFERGSQTDRGFEVDDLLRDTSAGDVHFSLHVPDSYDGSEPYALYVHCPGWEGLWFQGVGANLQEDFAFVANDYLEKMIVVSPQLDDWGETSAQKTIALTRWMLASYNIDAKRVYLSGCSGGGETISLVLGMAPELYCRALHMSSQWDGNTTRLVEAELPVRMSIGEEDEYYGSGPARRAYKEIRKKYRKRGLSKKRIRELLVLDVKPASYFDGFEADSYREHGGGAALFSHDAHVMGWLFR